MALLIQSVSEFLNEFLSLSNRERNWNDVEVVWCEMGFHLLQMPGDGSITSDKLLLSFPLLFLPLSSLVGRGERRVLPPPGPDPKVWAIWYITALWYDLSLELFWCNIARNRVSLRHVMQPDNFLHVMLQVFLIWLTCFVNLFFFCLVWRVAQISDQMQF